MWAAGFPRLPGCPAVHLFCGFVPEQHATVRCNRKNGQRRVVEQRLQSLVGLAQRLLGLPDLDDALFQTLQDLSQPGCHVIESDGQFAQFVLTVGLDLPVEVAGANRLGYGGHRLDGMDNLTHNQKAQRGRDHKHDHNQNHRDAHRIHAQSQSFRNCLLGNDVEFLIADTYPFDCQNDARTIQTGLDASRFVEHAEGCPA